MIFSVGDENETRKCTNGMNEKVSGTRTHWIIYTKRLNKLMTNINGEIKRIILILKYYIIFLNKQTKKTKNGRDKKKRFVPLANVRTHSQQCNENWEILCEPTRTPNDTNTIWRMDWVRERERCAYSVAPRAPIVGPHHSTCLRCVVGCAAGKRVFLVAVVAADNPPPMPPS